MRAEDLSFVFSSSSRSLDYYNVPHFTLTIRHPYIVAKVEGYFLLAKMR